MDMNFDLAKVVLNERQKYIPNSWRWVNAALLDGDDGVPWVLSIRYEVSSTKSGTWMNGKLVRCRGYHKPGKKRFRRGDAKNPTSVYFGWNGNRFAKQSALLATIDDHPDMMVEVQELIHEAWMLMTAGCGDLNNGGLNHV